jgi:hypothetical protein
MRDTIHPQKGEPRDDAKGAFCHSVGQLFVFELAAQDREE